MIRDNPDVVLMITDVIMPQMNGKDLSELILQEKPDIRCLFISGYPSNVIAHSGVLDPGVDYMPKPFSLTTLSIKVKEILARKE